MMVDGLRRVLVITAVCILRDCRRIANAAAALSVLVTLPVGAQVIADTVTHNCRFVMVPMRDGVRLNTKVCEAKVASAPLPIILNRTPYGISEMQEINGWYRFLAADGYQFVYQDIRGRFGSEGQFLMNAPLAGPKDLRKTDESTDAYDTVEWLLKNVANNNERVGVHGQSYDGFLTTMAGVNPHPAVKAISPQAPMTDTWMGDDFFHQGAFRLSYGFEYAGWMELSTDGSVPLPIGSWDTYDWYLSLGSLANVDEKYFKGKAPTWSAFVAHPTYDAYWQARAVQRSLDTVVVPTLTVGGWWDQEDRWGPLATYKALERSDRFGKNFLVMGPWNHGGWHNESKRMPVVDPGTSEEYLRDIEAPFFALYLKDRASKPRPEAKLYDAGAKMWRSFDTWPPRNGQAKSFYLRGDGLLSFEAPKNGESLFHQYVSDPAYPVPYRARPVEQTYDARGSRWAFWETEDQRFVDGRPDVMTWKTDPLQDDVTIAGDVVAHLVASTTGRDADWVVKLIDVLPDSVPGDWKRGGFELMVAHEIMRGRYRTSFTNPQPIEPNRPAEFTVDLHQQSYTFRKGHRVMVQVQSTWFPLYDRNPQTWVKNIFQAKPTDFQAQTHRIWHMPLRASRVDVTVVPSK